MNDFMNRHIDTIGKVLWYILLILMGYLFGFSRGIDWSNRTHHMAECKAEFDSKPFAEVSSECVQYYSPGSE